MIALVNSHTHRELIGKTEEEARLVKNSYMNVDQCLHRYFC